MYSKQQLSIQIFSVDNELNKNAKISNYIKGTEMNYHIDKIN